MPKAATKNKARNSSVKKATTCSVRKIQPHSLPKAKRRSKEGQLQLKRKVDRVSVSVGEDEINQREAAEREIHIRMIVAETKVEMYEAMLKSQKEVIDSERDYLLRILNQNTPILNLIEKLVTLRLTISSTQQQPPQHDYNQQQPQTQSHPHYQSQSQPQQLYQQQPQSLPHSQQPQQLFQQQPQYQQQHFQHQQLSPSLFQLPQQIYIQQQPQQQQQQQPYYQEQQLQQQPQQPNNEHQPQSLPHSQQPQQLFQQQPQYQQQYFQYQQLSPSPFQLPQQPYFQLQPQQQQQQSSFQEQPQQPNNEQQPPTVPITPTYPPYYVVPRPQEPERSDANEAFRALLSNNTNVLASNSTAYFAYLLGNSKK